MQNRPFLLAPSLSAAWVTTECAPTTVKWHLILPVLSDCCVRLTETCVARAPYALPVRQRVIILPDVLRLGRAVTSHTVCPIQSPCTRFLCYNIDLWLTKRDCRILMRQMLPFSILSKVVLKLFCPCLILLPLSLLFFLY